MSEHGIGVPTTRLSFHPGGKKTNSLEKFAKEAGIERAGVDPDIDPAKAKDNIYESQYGYTSGQEVIDHAQRRLEEISKAKGKAVRKDAVPLCATIVKPSAAVIQKLPKDEQLKMCQAAVEEAQIVIGARILTYGTKKKLADVDRQEALERGKKATVMVAYHFDEGAPHPHIFWEPIVWKDGIPKTESKIHDSIFLGGLNKIPARMNERGYDFKLAFDYEQATEEQIKEHKENSKSGMSSLQFKQKKREELTKEIEAKQAELAELKQEIEELAEKPTQEIETDKTITGKTIVKNPEQIEVQTKQLKAYKRKMEEIEIQLGRADKKIDSLKTRAEEAEARADKAEETIADICRAVFYRQWEVLISAVQSLPFYQKLTKSMAAEKEKGRTVIKENRTRHIRPDDDLNR